PDLAERILKQGLKDEYPLYVHASHQHQANFIKEGTERSRKNPLKAGYSMCAWNDIEEGIHWGILDAFCNPKGITARQMGVYNAQSVLLLDFIDATSCEVQLVPDYCRPIDLPFVVQPYAAYFGHQPVADASLEWRLRDAGGEVIAEDRVERLALQQYTVTTLPRITVSLPDLPGAQQTSLELKLQAQDLELRNSWPVWLFPKAEGRAVRRAVAADQSVVTQVRRVAPNVLVAEEAGGETELWVTSEAKSAVRWLEEGRTVLYLAKGGASPNPFDPGWFKSDGHLGSIIRTNELLGDFPHDGYASWQFRNLLDRALAVPEGRIPARPVISSVYGDSWPHVQHQILVAAAPGGGHLTYCLLRVLSGRCEADDLLHQLLENARRRAGDPVVPLDQLQRFMRDPTMDPNVLDDDFSGPSLGRDWNAHSGSCDLAARPGWLQITSRPNEDAGWVRKACFLWPLAQDFQVETRVRTTDVDDSYFVGLAFHFLLDGLKQEWIVTGLYHDSASPTRDGILSRSMVASSWMESVGMPDGLLPGEAVDILYRFDSDRSALTIGVKLPKDSDYTFLPKSADLSVVPAGARLSIGTWNEGRAFVFSPAGSPSDVNVGQWDFFDFGPVKNP
ncbi:MAG: hypothetical protein GY778_14065, partial [bacterium]|nr:hypothetical protein [bacterium]